MAKLIRKFFESLNEQGLIPTLKKLFLYALTKLKHFPKELVYSFYKLFKATDSLIIKKIQGSYMLLNLADEGISKELLLTGVHEKNSTLFFKNSIQKGMHVLDIGANIGYYALIASRIIGKTGRIYAFEPSPFNFNILKINMLLNDKASIFDLHNAAIGSKDSVGTFYIYSKRNMSSFVKRKEEKGVKIIGSVDVKVIKLDSFVKNKKIDYLRMDVEGYEAEILKGMKKLLSRKDKPKGMFIEIHSELLHSFGTNAEKFVKDLVSYGYKVKKSFFRGKKTISVSSTKDLLNHPLLESGYWETFFVLDKSHSLGE